jgi:transposase
LPALQTTYDNDLAAFLHITAMAADSVYTPVAQALGCLRRISTLTAFGLAVEIGDWNRFTDRSIAAFIRLVPSEHSSGGSHSQGPIAKTGNGHARRLLVVEPLGHHRTAYRPPPRALLARWQRQVRSNCSLSRPLAREGSRASAGPLLA